MAEAKDGVQPLPTCEYENNAAKNTVFLMIHGVPFLSVVNSKSSERMSFSYPREWIKETHGGDFVLKDRYGVIMIEYTENVLCLTPAFQIQKARQLIKTSFSPVSERVTRSVCMDVLKHWNKVKQIPNVEFVDEWTVMVQKDWMIQEFREFTVVQNEMGEFVFEYDQKTNTMSLKE